ncbi:MAG: molybdopterin molybdotransferase MoeA [Gemmataceae bacterium]|nr:molybdopterin molybdotransferase MoeA [Gemmataceae bacterium]MDW8267321.1 molybdopterin molybdotransferase MoeA [Gemmataceae bacterium]
MTRDVRMRGFRDRVELPEVLRLIDERVAPLPSEEMPLHAAFGRVLAQDVVAPVAVPGFDRSAMDGYAVRAGETFGAEPYQPVELRVVGESFPGRPFPGCVGPGEAVRIMTGAPLPAGADAVVPAELADDEAGRLRVREAVPPGRHVGRVGEDIAAGSVVLRAGRRLRPQDLGILASIGVSSVRVVRRPTVALLITGDELLPCGSRPEGFRIVDSNSIMLAALVSRDGGQPSAPVLLADNADTIRAALTAATEDVILVSGGSSVGQEDHAPRVLGEVGELGVHGVALRPASPSGVGFLQHRPVFLLPGNPVSCLCAYDLFAGRAIRRLGGRPVDLPYRTRRLPLRRKIVSAIGRVDYVRVCLAGDAVEPLAVSGASLLSTTTRADGFVLVPGDREGHAEGEEVEVYLYDPP